MVFADVGRRSPERRESSSGTAVSGPVSGLVHRPRLENVVRRASGQSNIAEAAINTAHLADEKPVATGNGVSVIISLAEPVLFLQGFDQNDETTRNTTMLRGSLLIRVTKQAKLKSITLNFRGKSETDWPEGIPPRRVEFRDNTTIMNHTWPFFNASFPAAEHSYGADIVQLQKGPSVDTKELSVTSSSFDIFQRSASPAKMNLSSRDAKKLSLQTNQARSFGKGDTMSGGPTVAAKGFKVFHPGDYIYNFELPLDSRLPESINVDLGYVKYELEALVERSGAFRTNLMGSKELTLIRAPTEGSLEQTEPIAISRNWEDQLHYDIVISGKSFPLGSTVPIAFKLTPLAKVQCHRIKVFVTENVQYFTANKKVHRLEPTRKVQLFEKRADGPSVSSYPGSSMRITAGGGIPYDYRAAAASGNEDIPRDTTNLLGNLDNDVGSIGPTEMEFNVQLPSCHMMKDKVRSDRLHFDTTYANIQVNHWIKVSLLLESDAFYLPHLDCHETVEARRE
jgi:arrestin-related trafficking adapter 3/6